MKQVCSRTKCSAVIEIQEGQTVAMFDGKPICAKCDRFLNKPFPARKIEPAKKPYEEPEAYKEEVVHDGRAPFDYPAHLPPPKPGCAVRREQVLDEEGVMRYKYITRSVESEKKRDIAGKLTKLVKNVAHLGRS